MKKLLSIGLLTLGVLAITENSAHAWVNAKFSIGLNWHLQSANNNTLWGLWKNGQVPGPEAFGQPGGGPYGPMAPGMMGPGGMNQPVGVFPFFGANPQGYPQGFPYGAPQSTPASFPTETAPPPTANSQSQLAQYPQDWYQNLYQPVSYQTGGYYYPSQYYPSQYYPNYYQGYSYQVPSYWYQNR